MQEERAREGEKQEEPHPDCWPRSRLPRAPGSAAGTPSLLGKRPDSMRTRFPHPSRDVQEEEEEAEAIEAGAGGMRERRWRMTRSGRGRRERRWRTRRTPVALLAP